MGYHSTEKIVSKRHALRKKGLKTRKRNAIYFVVHKMQLKFVTTVVG